MSSAMPEIPFAAVVVTGGLTVILASVLAFLMLKTKSTEKTEPKKEEEEEKKTIDRSKYPGGEIAVYYGTQTGTAESFGRQLEREGAEHGFFVHVVDLEDIGDVDKLTEERKDADTGVARAFFLMSTYGEGEPTDNTVDFATRLKELANTDIIVETEEEEAPSEKPLSNLLEYGVFGLGNKEYEHYNAMGKFFDRALERIGGKRVVELGLGDDCQDLEGDFETWKDTHFWPVLKKLYVQDAAALKKADHDELPSATYAVEYHDTNNNPQEPVMDIPLENVHGSSRHYFTAVDCPVQVIRELRSKEDKGSTVHMEIDISKAANNLQYETADNLGVLPINQSSVVEAVAQRLQFDLNKTFSLTNAEGHEWHGAPFPMPLTVRECLTRYCDLTCAPRRSDLKLLASYAKDPIDKKALLRMASKEGKAEYKEKILEAHMGLADVLQMCPSIEAPLEHFLSFCPLLQTRFYTISSSSSVHPKSVHLTVAVTEGPTKKDGTVFHGLCSSYLANLKVGDTIRIYNRASSFRLPQDPSKPILMVGPGTGVAPFRALLQERQYQKETKKVSVGANVLYFGCKKRTLDYLYEDELTAFSKSGILTELHLAFSREQTEKIYVQNLLEKNAKDTWKLVKSGGYIYVCGGVKMGNDVMEAFKQILVKEGNMSVEDVKQYVNKLSHEGRYVQELWA